MEEGLHRRLGLSDGESDEITRRLGRPPNHLELAMYAVMWSEHCSYKSSRLHLRRLPSEGEQVIVGPGENAGVVDAGDGVAVAVRIESHNHPSAIEPHQGAATGVGGILRDVFTMGARPIALLDSLRFGAIDHPRSRWLLHGVVGGISAYGNAVGVPTVGGELGFEETFSDNPLVNVACVGVLPVDRLVLGRASGVGNLAVLLGSTTGRDGIGGVSVLASAGFAGSGPGEGAGDLDASKRPSVQVGDPFEEKRLIEACLELLDAGLVVGIQDLGGAGLTCATSETAARAGLGMDVNVGAVSCREPGMAAFEIMTSESQERMLAIVTPSHLDEVLSVCDRWEVRAAVVGRVTAPPGAADRGGRGDPSVGRDEGVGRLRILDGWKGSVLADVPAASLADDAPLYDRPLSPPSDLSARRKDDPAALEPPSDCGEDLLEMLADPSWAYRQYDHQLFLNTVVGPGGDAALLRLRAPGLADTDKAIAVSVDGSPRWCAADPRRGTAMVVAESTLNVACSGGRPIALVNCLNFGNPEHPEVMWQLAEAVDGMAEACRVLDVPVVGGNVSLYNESGGRDIDPTPVVLVVGLVDHLVRRPPGAALVGGGRVLLLGAPSAALGGSRWAVEARGHRGGELAAVDLVDHADLLQLVRDLVAGAQVTGLHDVSEGGLAVCLAEMAIGGGVGARLSGVAGHAELFSESASRVVVCTTEAGRVSSLAEAAGVAVTDLGPAEGDRLMVEGLVDLPVELMRRRWLEAIPAYLRRPSSSERASAATSRSPRPEPTERSGL